MKKKTMWIITMLGLCLVLYTIVVSRMESSTNVIFGGAEDAFVRTDSMNFTDLSATETPEPTVDIWPKLTTDDFEKNHCLWMVRENSLLSSAYKPDIAKISRTRYMMYSTEYMAELDAFLDAIEDAGFEYFIGAAFREYSFQTHLFNSKASQIAYEMGLSADYLDPKYQEAVEKAKTIVMYPGRADLENIAVGNGVGLVQNRVEPAADALAVVNTDAAVLIDKDAQEPASGLTDIFNVPKAAAFLLDHGLCKLRDLVCDLTHIPLTFNLPGRSIAGAKVS